MTTNPITLANMPRDFDSHLLTGDDHMISPRLQVSSNFDSHLLTGDDRDCSSVCDSGAILTHISSPEMTKCHAQGRYMPYHFDSHLLTGDDVCTFCQTSTCLIILTHISSPEMTSIATPFASPRDILTHISSPEMTLSIAFCIHSFQKTFWLTSPHRRWQCIGLLESILTVILTHISSPEMTLQLHAGLLHRKKFWLTSPHRRWLFVSDIARYAVTNFDSHLLTGDDASIASSIKKLD